MASLQASGAHQPPDPLAGHSVAAHDELGPHAPHAGVAMQLAVDLLDLVGQLGVGALALAQARDPPPVVARPGHPQLRAHKRHRVWVLFVVGPVRDSRVLHGWSFANQAATFFAKSRSIRRTAFSLRSRSNSRSEEHTSELQS